MPPFIQQDDNKGQELSEIYFRLLMLDRIDVLIGLPEEAMCLAEKMGSPRFFCQEH